MTWIFNKMHKTSIITRPPKGTPNSYIRCLLGIYRWMSNMHHKLKMSKPNSWISSPTSALADSSRCSSKILQLSSTLHFSSHLLFNPSAHPVSFTFKTYPNFYNKILEKKIFRLWLTTSHHSYCHIMVQITSNSLLDYYKNHLTCLPASFYLCTLEPTLNITVKTCVRSRHLPTEIILQYLPNSSQAKLKGFIISSW